MGFGQAVASAFANYVNFSGRATRSEYWWFFLFCIIVFILAMVVDTFVLGFPYPEQIGPAYIVGLVATLLPSLAVTARRFHDIDRSGWWVLIVLIPLVGAILFIVWMCKASDSGANRFGSLQPA